MALKKTIRQNDGVTTEYHRILFLQQMVNSHTSIAVVSHIDADLRAVPGSYQQAITYETNYDENMTIKSAYEYLKTLSEFEGALDV